MGELMEAVEPRRGANQNIGTRTDTKVQTRTENAKQSGLSKREQVTVALRQ